jgi:hypothetical protein
MKPICGTRLELATDEHLDADAGGVKPYRVLHVHRDLLVRAPNSARTMSRLTTWTKL